MTTPDPSLAHSVGELLEAHRVAYGRYHQLLDAMRVALKSEDLALLAHLAEQATALLSAVEQQHRLPAGLEEMVGRGTTPEGAELRNLLIAVRIDREQARAGLAALLEKLTDQRSALFRALATLSGAPQGPGNPYRGNVIPPTALDTTG